MTRLRLTRLSGAGPLSQEDVAVLKSSRSETGRPVAAAEEWIGAAQDGDRNATQALLLALLPRVRNLVRYLVRGDDDTDDISQEALLSIVRGLGGFRADGALKSWVDRVVVRTTFAFIRKRRREPAHVAARTAFQELDGSSVIVLPDEYLSRRRAMAVLDELPLEQRHAVVLHHVLEMSVPEIAAQLAISGETVRSRLRLARTRLRGKGLDIDMKSEDGASPETAGAAASVGATDAGTVTKLGVDER